MKRVIGSLSILALCLTGCGDDDDGGGGGGDGSTTTGSGDGTSSGSGTGSGGTGSGGSDDGGTGTGGGGSDTTGSSGTGTGSSGTGTTDTGTGTGSSSGTGTGTGSSSGTATGTGTGSSSGTGTGTGSSSGTGTGTGSSSGTGTGTGTGTGSSSGTATGTGSSSGGTTTGGGLIPCETADATLEPTPPNIMLVLDKSGSMVRDENKWDHDNDCGGLCEDFGQPGPHCADGNATNCVTRWYSLYQVVDFIVTSFNAQINFGAILFPSTSATATYNENACLTGATPEVPVAPLNQDAILNGIPAATSGDTVIRGGTPTSRGISASVTHLNGLAPENPPAMILVTDGAANCEPGAVCNNPSDCPLLEDYDPDLHPAVNDAWLTDGIPTYVVGIDIDNFLVTGVGVPDVNPYEKLNELAPLGGRPKPNGPPHFYQTVNQVELQDALQEIIDDTLSCIVDLDPLPPEPENISVFIGGVEVPEITDCATEDGWMYVNPPPYDQIELCGTACTDLKAQGEVYIEYYCTPG